MRTTITIRAEAALRSNLVARARASGKTLSELVREILEDALDARPLGARIGRHRGRIELPRRPTDPWRARLRERNARP